MEFLHIVVLAQDTVWDQLLISHDGVLFMPSDSQYYKIESTDKGMVKNTPIKKLVRSVYAEDILIKPNIRNGQDVVEKENKLGISLHGEGDSCMPNQELRQLKHLPHLHINGYLLSLFVKTVQQSLKYRRGVIANFKDCTKRISYLNNIPEISLHVKLMSPHKDIIDYAWNERLERLAVERRELENAMSWLSTLGGAFSALGEEFKNYAEIAGRISVQQFTIALRLGDPLTVIRCKLYLALSLVQRGYLLAARHIIEEQYHLAQSSPIVDTRLVSMCLGIWAKLKYEYHKNKVGRKRKGIEQ